MGEVMLRWQGEGHQICLAALEGITLAGWWCGCSQAANASNREAMQDWLALAYNHKATYTRRGVSLI